MPNAGDVLLAYRQFDSQVPEALVFNLYKDLKKVMANLQYLLRVPTAQQLAAVLCAYRTLSHEVTSGRKYFRPLMMEIAAGKGKSYVEALTIGLFIRNKADTVNHFIIAFHSEAQL